MTSVIISEKFEITIPKHMLDSVGLAPGMQCDLVCSNGVISVVPIVAIKDLRGKEL